MNASKTQNVSAIGFLSVISNEQLGDCGGYLILNQMGRPLEFHCTAPVKANRAQQILYGPTLKPFLFGEQIGQTLVSKSKITPRLICTDVEPVMSLRPLVSTPVVLVDATAETPRDAEADPDRLAARQWRLDTPHDSMSEPRCQRLVRFRLGERSVAVEPRWEQDREQIQSHFKELVGAIDLAEPFTRIHDAIREAQSNSR